MKLTRRNFLKSSLSGLAYFSAAATVPAWISKSAFALSSEIPDDRILVIVQLSGGNDGLNTVIPFTDSLYNGNTLRPELHITSGLTPTAIDGLNAFHPKMIRLKDWFDEGIVAVIQNVGYPNPDLSHFVATDFWEFGTSTGSALTSTQGWMARFIDNQCAGIPPENIDPLTMLGAGQFLVPATLAGSALYTPPAVFDFDFYQIFVPGGDAADFGEYMRQKIEEFSGIGMINPAVDFVQRAANVAHASIEDMEVAAMQPTRNVFPAGSLGDGLSMTSKVIRAGFGTKVFYVSQGGYDTHSQQYANNDPVNFGDHQRLLNELDQSLHAFLADMNETGNLDRVCVMTFSEFGRRAAQNGSMGTDHGAGNCLFVIGGKVTGGVYGGQPDLANLLSGNLRHTIDFRSVYSRVLQDWFGVDPEPIFGTADFTDPILDIQGGIEQIPIFGAALQVYGDVTGDGKVDAADVQKVVNTAIGIENDPATDITGDGKTNAIDLQIVVNEALKGI